MIVTGEGEYFAMSCEAIVGCQAQQCFCALLYGKPMLHKLGELATKPISDVF